MTQTVLLLRFLHNLKDLQPQAVPEAAGPAPRRPLVLLVLLSASSRPAAAGEVEVGVL